MLLLVATMKPTKLTGWSEFYRIKIMGDHWEEIDERKKSSPPWRIWQPSDPNNPSEENIGGWSWSAGGFLKFWPLPVASNLDGRSVMFENVHWNFRDICQRQMLTGTGFTLPEKTKITWVMGSGFSPVRQLSCDDPQLRPSDCAEPILRLADPLKKSSTLGVPHTEFKIRILRGKASSSRGAVIGMKHRDEFDFEIVDVVSGKSIKLHYSSDSGQAGTQMPGSPGNLEPIFVSPQPFTDFSTTGPVERLSDFTGPAKMISLPKTGKLQLSVQSNKLRPPPSKGPGLIVDLKADKGPVFSSPLLSPLLNVGSETSGSLEISDPKAELLEAIPKGLGLKPVPPG